MRGAGAGAHRLGAGVSEGSGRKVPAAAVKRQWPGTRSGRNVPAAGKWQPPVLGAAAQPCAVSVLLAHGCCWIAALRATRCCPVWRPTL